MPNVGPGQSPPAVRGTVEENEPELSGQAAADPQVTPRPPAGKNCLGTLLSPPARCLTQSVLPSVGVEEDNVIPEQLHLEGVCVGAREGRAERNREDILKQISVSSSAFIGPACRPAPAIEKELSDFYKELQELEQQDGDDGRPGGDECIPQSVPAPAVNPPVRKEIGADQRSACRPYPAARPQRDCGNSGGWRPRPHGHMKQDDSFNHLNQNQCPPPPRLPHGPPGIRDLEPWRFFPRPPAENPFPPPNLQHHFTGAGPADRGGGAWQAGPGFPLGGHARISSSTCSGALEERGRNSHQRQNHTDQNRHQPNQHHHNHMLNQYQQNSHMGLVLVLMRGAPGSGKSTLAREILWGAPRGLILSTDDFFQENGSSFDPALLGDAHQWNQGRARDAMSERRSPVIIDNTNVQAWEMKPYVQLALDHGYQVQFVEPDTRWRYDPTELEKRNRHGVPRSTIQKMLQRFEAVSVEAVLNSWEPPEKNREPHAQRRPHLS